MIVEREDRLVFPFSIKIEKKSPQSRGRWCRALELLGRIAAVKHDGLPGDAAGFCAGCREST
jgi:hypothetical protein